MARANAVILLSGGVDSATAAAIAKQQGFDLHALSFRYGQRHERELASAQQVAAFLQAKTHQILSFDLRAIGGSALTDDIAVPKGRSEAEMGKGIPVTYVPARNTIFLSFALALAERSDSTTAAIRIAARNIFRRLSGWPISPPKPASKVKIG